MMLTPENTVLLVVDIQERLLPVLHRVDEFTAACCRLITGTGLLGVPALISEQYPKGLGHTADAVRTLLVQAPVYEKTRFSAFTDEIQAALAERRPENLILIGCETHICMLQTALDALAAGYGVYVPQECVSSRTPANIANGLQQMAAAGVVVGNIESLLFQLLCDAKHPQFKAISKLIQ